ncbi:hypothetical protein QUF80_14395 [Desulfococcaceae bacterium HSG8]|nr:hypothetical protein [Desulfococcaceae bacterium HSG8]
MTITYNSGKRQKFRIDLSGLQNDLSIAREKFQIATFLEAFDIYEQLIAAYPRQWNCLPKSMTVINDFRTKTDTIFIRHVNLISASNLPTKYWTWEAVIFNITHRF